MRLLRSFFFCLAVGPLTALADVPAPPRPPGWPTTDYKTIVADLDQTTFVVVDYGNGTKAIVSDQVWLAEFKRLLAGATGKPANLCFCVNHPQIAFLTKGRQLATLELPHGEKLRFAGPSYSGDFEVDKKVVRAIAELAMSQHANALPKNPSVPTKPELPKKIELKP